MSKARKKIFPKPPVRFHSKLEKDLGKWSNKTDVRANLMAIYYQPSKPAELKVSQTQAKQLERLRAAISKTKGNV